MQGADDPSRLPRTLFTFNSLEDIRQFATGCDADIGGTSTVHLDFDESPTNNASIGKKATGVFWGDMRLGVKAGLEGTVRGGYAGFRNKVRWYPSYKPLLKVVFVPCRRDLRYSEILRRTCPTIAILLYDYVLRETQAHTILFS